MWWCWHGGWGSGGMHLWLSVMLFKYMYIYTEYNTTRNHPLYMYITCIYPFRNMYSTCTYSYQCQLTSFFFLLIDLCLSSEATSTTFSSATLLSEGGDTCRRETPPIIKAIAS